MKKIINSAVFLLAIYPFFLQASIRCQNGLVSEGENSFEVLKKCGVPVSKEIINPIAENYNKSRSNAATVETWVYGPNNGAYMFFKFIDGTLVNIQVKRLQ